MKYIEEYLNDVIKVKPLGKLTTKDDELNGMSGEMVYIDGKCSDIFISHADYANWLEKQGEQKSAWSEDDESMCTRCIGILGKCYMGVLPTKVEEELNWLKSFKDRMQSQNHWKPTDDQIKAIRLAKSFVTDDFDDHPTLSDILMELEEQLKKLKEE